MLSPPACAVITMVGSPARTPARKSILSSNRNKNCATPPFQNSSLVPVSHSSRATFRTYFSCAACLAVSGCIRSFQDVSDLPSVERDGREPPPAEDVPQPAVDAPRRGHPLARRVPDRRHLLRPGQSGKAAVAPTAGPVPRGTILNYVICVGSWNGNGQLKWHNMGYSH